ncbi:MAG TPA: PKD domain-containing protein [Brumimicrobium sp.]|nr:PKD domain-containing protein [Brumimicrobium sp.]
MRQILFIIFTLFYSIGFNQTTIWTEDFENSLTDWDLSITIGAVHPNANIWAMSDAEGGVSASNCAVKANGNKTLHVTCQGMSCTAVGSGAVYYPGDNGLGGFPGDTEVRAALISPINTTGESQLEISFDWMGIGQANFDFAELEYSIDGGASWNSIWTQTPGALCGSGEAEWARESVNLPADAENQADLRFAFKWQNNNDGNGMHPSFAVNDLELVSNGIPGGTYANFTTPNFTICENDCIDFTDASTGTNISAWDWTFDGADTPTSTNKNPGNICYPTVGTYDVTLTITDDNGTSTVTQQVTVGNCAVGLPTAAFAVDTLIVCEGDCISFKDLSVGSPVAWSWTFQGAETLSSNLQNPTDICFKTAGTYDVSLTVTNSNGSDQITSSIIILDIPEINAFGDTLIDMGGAALLFAQPLGTGTVFWDPADHIDCPTCLEVIATPYITTTYYPSILGTNGCVGRDTVTVAVNFEEVVEVPSAFSPDGDGVNDFIRVLGIGITSIDFKIYNRYGQLVFATTDITEGWDGTMNGEELNQGVFVYTLSFDLVDGSSGKKSGNITLVK